MFDLVIQHARICDGTGKPNFLGMLAVTDGLGREAMPAGALGLSTTIS